MAVERNCIHLSDYDKYYIQIARTDIVLLTLIQNSLEYVIYD